MKAFFLIVVLLFFIPPALAGEVFVKKNENSESQQLFTKKPEKILSPEEQLKKLANDYYESCLAAPHSTLTPNAQQLLCACTSAKMTEEMDAEQIKDLSEETTAGDAARSHMLMFVYAPCMRYPAEEMIETTCLNSEDVSRVPMNKRQLCSCLGKEMGKFMESHAPNVVGLALREDPKTMDPFRTFFQSYAFNAQSRQHMAICMQKLEQIEPAPQQQR